MKRNVANIRGKKLITEYYDSVNELLRICDNREYNGKYREKSRYKTDSDDIEWAGGSYDECVKLLLNGWDEKTALIKSKLAEVKSKTTSDRRAVGTKLDVVGYAPCVPNLLRGVPKTMYNSRFVAKKQKIVNIIYEIGVSSGTPTDLIIEKGVELLTKINNLEMSGYRVKLSVSTISGQTYDDTWYNMVIPIKNEHQPLDLSRVAFAMAHPGMLRNISFDWLERLPNAHKVDGYGRPLYARDWDGYRESIRKALSTDNNALLITYTSNLDEEFKNIK